MKRLVKLLLIVFVTMVCLSSCRPVNALLKYGSLKHEHIVSEWILADEYHYRAVTCTWEKCDISPGLYNHVDDDNNDICDLCGSEHEHIFGQWHYDDEYHWCTAECTWNGCDIDTTTEHHDSDGNSLCDACGYVMTEHEHIYGQWCYDDEYHWCEVDCTWNACDIITKEEHFDNDGDEFCDECKSLVYERIPLTQYEPWLAEITADGVQKIITYSYDGWRSPELQTIISTANPDIIAQLINEYNQVVVKKNSLIEYDILAGGFEIEFYLDDGSVKRMEFYGGGHFYGGHPVNKTPTLDRSEFTDVDRRYSLITYGGFAEIYSHSIVSSLSYGFLVGRINLEIFEFKECTCDPENYPSDSFSPNYFYFCVEDERIEAFGETYHLLYDGKIYDIVNSGRADLSGIDKIKAAHEGKYNDGRTAFVEAYYGSFENGAICAMVSDDYSGYDDGLWSETVAGYTFRYSNGNRIVVLFEGDFYTLPEAYENGCLSSEDVKSVKRLHT